MTELVKIIVTTDLLNRPEEKLTITTPIQTEFGDYQSVDDEVNEFVFEQFSDWPAAAIKKVSWFYV